MNSHKPIKPSRRSRSRTMRKIKKYVDGFSSAVQGRSRSRTHRKRHHKRKTNRK